MTKRHDDVHDRLVRASVLLLTDESPEGQTLLNLLINVDVDGDELLDAIELAEQHLTKEGKTI